MWLLTNQRSKAISKCKKEEPGVVAPGFGENPEAAKQGAALTIIAVRIKILEAYQTKFDALLFYNSLNERMNFINFVDYASTFAFAISGIRWPLQNDLIGLELTWWSGYCHWRWVQRAICCSMSRPFGCSNLLILSLQA